MRELTKRHVARCGTGLALTLLCCASVARPQSVEVPGRMVAPLASFDSAWASISRTFWDTALVNGRWRVAHDSLRLVAATSADDAGVRAAIRALIAVPAASHFALIPGDAAPAAEATPASDARAEAPRRPGTTGLDARMLGDTVVVWRVQAGSAAERAGIRPGHTITHVDTMAVDSVRARLRRALPEDPTQALRLLNTWVLGRLAGRSEDTLRITLRDARGRARTHRLVRAPLAGQLTRFGNLPPLVVASTGDSVALGGGRFAPVIAFTAWFPAVAGELDKRLFAIRSAPGLVLDLRGNPGGVIGMLAGVSGHLLDTAVSLGTMRGRGATINFVANPRRVNPAGERVAPYGGPLAILVDEFTGSTSEFFSSGLQAIGRARVFGVRSAGQALPAVMVRLPNGDVLMHAIADHEDAAGRRVEGPGVQPDERTPLTRADLLAGRDAALEAARAWLARHPR